ncbi:MAG: hypothetical protein ABR600_04025 [Actinomycetota bacterium]
MRLSELVGSEVRDGNKRVMGRVLDVRVVQDGPDVEGFGKAFRIHALLVGKRPAIRLGLERPEITGPLLFRALDRWMERHRTLVPWEQVESFEPGSVVVKRTKG